MVLLGIGMLSRSVKLTIRLLARVGVLTPIRRWVLTGPVASRRARTVAAARDPAGGHRLRCYPVPVSEWADDPEVVESIERRFPLDGAVNEMGSICD